MRTDPAVATPQLRLMEDVLSEAAEKVYEMHNRQFTPLYPWVFVRVLPKEQIQNGIILPATEQNKTIHEGIVLATWQKTEKIDHECAVKVGWHVLFPHFAGLPIAGYSDKHYRVIRSEDWVENQQGGIFAYVEYDAPSSKPIEKLLRLIEASTSGPLPTGWMKLATEIEKQFLLVDREGSSVTLSGR